MKIESSYIMATEDMESIWRVCSDAEAEVKGENNYGLLILEGLVGGSFEQLEHVPEDMHILDSISLIDMVSDTPAITEVA
jgi:hypothetical protein